MPLIEAHNVRYRYSAKGPWVIDDVSLEIREGVSIGVVGESGSGKSTLIRLLNGLHRVQSGRIRIDGEDIDRMSGGSRRLRTLGQIVFQSPRKSFDPRMRIRTAVAQPVRALERRSPRRPELEEWTERVGLPVDVLDRYPHQLSGGQLQRVSVARAISVRPRILYADEPTSALDVSVQAQVLRVIEQMRSELGLTLVMVTHDLAVAATVCDELVVMRNGRIVETGPTATVLNSPAEQYTADLVSAALAVSLRRTAPDREF